MYLVIHFLTSHISISDSANSHAVSWRSIPDLGYFLIRSLPYSGLEWGSNLSKLALLRRTLFRTPLSPCRIIRLAASMVSGIRDPVSLTVQERHTPPKTHIDEGLALVMGDESDLTPLEDEDEVEASKKHTRTRKKKATPKGVAVEGSNSRNTRGARKRTRSQAVENTATDSEVPPRKRKRACKPEPVYIIPDVEKKVTTFRGRLGTKYVCYIIFT